MATVPPPATPPPPPYRNQTGRNSLTPCPGHAAIPFLAKRSPPVQETSPSSETLHETEDAPANATLPEEDGPQFPLSQGQEYNSSESEEKFGPVQETDPVPQTAYGPQMTEQQGEAATQVDQAEEDQSL